MNVLANFVWFHVKFPKKSQNNFFQVPESCCKLDANGAKVECNNGNEVDTDRIYTSDCFTVALIFLRDHTVIIGGVAVGIAAIMVCKWFNYLRKFNCNWP